MAATRTTPTSSAGSRSSSPNGTRGAPPPKSARRSALTWPTIAGIDVQVQTAVERPLGGQAHQPARRARDPRCRRSRSSGSAPRWTISAALPISPTRARCRAWNGDRRQPLRGGALWSGHLDAGPGGATADARDHRGRLPPRRCRWQLSISACGSLRTNAPSKSCNPARADVGRSRAHFEFRHVRAEPAQRHHHPRRPAPRHHHRGQCRPRRIGQ